MSALHRVCHMFAMHHEKNLGSYIFQVSIDHPFVNLECEKISIVLEKLILLLEKS